MFFFKFDAILFRKALNFLKIKLIELNINEFYLLNMNAKHHWIAWASSISSPSCCWQYIKLKLIEFVRKSVEKQRIGPQFKETIGLKLTQSTIRMSQWWIVNFGAASLKLRVANTIIAQKSIETETKKK